MHKRYQKYALGGGALIFVLGTLAGGVYTSPGASQTTGTDSEKDAKSGSQVASKVWVDQGTWTIDSELFVADRGAGGTIAWKSVATSSITHTVN